MGDYKRLQDDASR